MLQQALTGAFTDGAKSLGGRLGGEIQFAGVLDGQNHRMASFGDDLMHLSEVGVLNPFGGDAVVMKKTIGGLQITPVVTLLGQRMVRSGGHCTGDRHDSFERRESPKSIPPNCLTDQAADGAHLKRVMREPPVQSDNLHSFARTTITIIDTHRTWTPTYG